jgi:hypothetical protein
VRFTLQALTLRNSRWCQRTTRIPGFSNWTEFGRLRYVTFTYLAQAKISTHTPSSMAVVIGLLVKVIRSVQSSIIDFVNYVDVVTERTAHFRIELC